MELSKRDRDKLNHASPKDVGQGVVAIADVVQRLPTHLRVLAAAGFLQLLVEEMDISPSEVMTVLDKIRRHADDKGRVEFKAIEAYVHNDLGKS